MACDWKHEEALHGQGYPVVCGMDEAGRGPLAGPVAVAAVILPAGYSHRWLDDSKKLGESRREQVCADLLATPGLVWSCIMIDAQAIDAMNILRATHHGMRQAVLSLSCRPDAALVDGLPVPDFPVHHVPLVGGDALSLSIAAASVIAKVHRDHVMREADAVHPEYGFAKHKGYGTRGHLEALRRHGPCAIHRRSFAPVARATA